VARDVVPRSIKNFVRSTKANVIGCNAAVTLRNEFVDDRAIEIRPCRHAMHHQNNRSISGTFIDVMHAQSVNIIVGDIEIVRLIRKVDKFSEIAVGSAKKLHSHVGISIDVTIAITVQIMLPNYLIEETIKTSQVMAIWSGKAEENYYLARPDS
jgi:hypothetical protein